MPPAPEQLKCEGNAADLVRRQVSPTLAREDRFMTYVSLPNDLYPVSKEMHPRLQGQDCVVGDPLCDLQSSPRTVICHRSSGAAVRTPRDGVIRWCRSGTRWPRKPSRGGLIANDASGHATRPCASTLTSDSRPQPFLTATSEPSRCGNYGHGRRPPPSDSTPRLAGGVRSGSPVSCRRRPPNQPGVSRKSAKPYRPSERPPLMTSRLHPARNGRSTHLHRRACWSPTLRPRRRGGARRTRRRACPPR